MENSLEHLQYPIGRFSLPASVTSLELHSAIEKISIFPGQILALVDGLREVTLDTPYRPGGWTVRQVIHHCADSHMNAFIRFKLALTEENPVIKPYHEALWAEHPDYRMEPFVSLMLLEKLHARWIVLMRNMQEEDWRKGFVHPEYDRVQTLSQIAMYYAWHGEHHMGHINAALKNIP